MQSIENPPELHRDPDAAADMAVNAVIRYLKQAGIEDPGEKLAWLENVYQEARSRLDT